MPSSPELQAKIDALRAENGRLCLRLEEKELQLQLLEYSLDGVWDWNIKTGYDYFSPRWKQMLGYEDAELENNVATWEHLLLPEDVAPAYAAVRAHWDEGKPYEIVLRYRRKDGSTAWMLARGHAIKDEHGDWVRMVGTHTDLTLLKETEAALRDTERRLQKLSTGLEERVAMRTADLRSSEERLRLVADSLPVLIAYVDRDLRYQFNNKGYELWFGHSRSELAGRPVRDVIGETAYNAARARFEGALSGTVQEFEQEIPHKDGGTRFVEGSFIPHRDPTGRIAGFFSLLSDTSERRRAEERRLKLEQKFQETQRLEALGLLAGGIAHDFNNLLMGILGYAGLAFRELSPESPARPLVEEIEKTGQKAAELCNQMLAYSGRGRFVVTAIDLNGVVEEMAQLLDMSVSEDALLEYDFAENLPAVEADVTQIRQVVLNLVVNASEAIGKLGGAITVSTGAMACERDYLDTTFLSASELPEGTYVYLEIADTGDGMDEVTREKVFEPFFTTKFTGRGLGLAAVLGIVRGHKGAIKVSSETGTGTTFKVLFPAVQQSARPLRRSDEPARDWRGSGTVLLVDDEEMVLKVGSMILERAGFGVLRAADGESALRLFHEHQGEIVCVLLDLVMPGMGGEETLRELRRAGSDVPVLLSSGFSEQDATSRFGGMGLAFLKKPYGPDELLAQVRTLMQGRVGHTDGDTSS